MPDSNFSAHDVARYYDSNTRRFLALGGSDRARAIHRALWGSGVADAEAAADHINVLIADALRFLHAEPGSMFLDLGCGVGGTLFALADRFPHSNLTGITISRQQLALARKFVNELELELRCRIRHADFENFDLGIEADVVFAIESMVHATSLPQFLAHASRHLKEGGTLLIVDDFIARGNVASAASRRVYRDFAAGWRLSSLTTVADLVDVAEVAGLELVEVRDLTPLIRLDRPRDRLIGALGPLMSPLVRVPMVGNMVGGAALTRGLRSGHLSYCWLRFTR